MATLRKSQRTLLSSQVHSQSRPTIRAKPVPRTLPSALNVPTPNFVDPDDPIMTDWQRTMLSAFDLYGHVGLCDTIYAHAHEKLMRGEKSKSWRVIIDDQETKLHYVFDLLMQLPDYLVRSLIRNTLSHDYFTDTTIRSFVQKQMTPGPWPSIYINIPARGPLQTFTAGGLIHSRDNAGKWLSSNEVDRLVGRIREYISSYPQPTATATAIDFYFDNRNAKAVKTTQGDNNRRYAADGRAVRSILRWLEVIERLFGNVAATERDKPFMRAPHEVGWAVDTTSCLKQHTENASTTNIFGLFNVLSRQPGPIGLNLGFPTPFQFMLFRIHKRDDTLAKTAEILGSILCSSYLEHGGYNHYPAGGLSMDNTKLLWDDYVWRVNITGVLGRSTLPWKTIQQINTNVKNTIEGLRKIEKLPTVIKEFHDLTIKKNEEMKRLQEIQDKVNEGRERARKAQAELDELKKRQAKEYSVRSPETIAVLDKARDMIAALRRKDLVNQLVRQKLRGEDHSRIPESEDPSIMADVEAKLEDLKARVSQDTTITVEVEVKLESYASCVDRDARIRLFRGTKVQETQERDAEAVSKRLRAGTDMTNDDDDDGDDNGDSDDDDSDDGIDDDDDDDDEDDDDTNSNDDEDEDEDDDGQA